MSVPLKAFSPQLRLVGHKLYGKSSCRWAVGHPVTRKCHSHVTANGTLVLWTVDVSLFGTNANGRSELAIPNSAKLRSGCGPTLDSSAGSSP